MTAQLTQDGSHLDYEAGYGGLWNFHDFDSGVRLGEDAVTPVAVYATWVGGSQWESAAVTRSPVRQTGKHIPLWSISNRLRTAILRCERPALGLLGVFDVNVGSTPNVQLSYNTSNGEMDGSCDGMLCVSDVMIHPLWTTVTILRRSRRDRHVRRKRRLSCGLPIRSKCRLRAAGRGRSWSCTLPSTPSMLGSAPGA